MEKKGKLNAKRSSSSRASPGWGAASLLLTYSADSSLTKAAVSWGQTSIAKVTEICLNLTPTGPKASAVLFSYNIRDRRASLERPPNCMNPPAVQPYRAGPKAGKAGPESSPKILPSSGHALPALDPAL